MGALHLSTPVRRLGANLARLWPYYEAQEAVAMPFFSLYRASSIQHPSSNSEPWTLGSCIARQRGHAWFLGNPLGQYLDDPSAFFLILARGSFQFLR